jgi:hypothetical protein
MCGYKFCHILKTCFEYGSEHRTHIPYKGMSMSTEVA